MSNDGHSGKGDAVVAKRTRRKREEIFSRELLDGLLKNYSKPEDLLGPDGMLKRLTAALVQRAMSAELTHHLGYANGEKPPEEQGNRRNGTTHKTLRSDRGELTVQVPLRRRAGAYP
jgi:putative transposase